VSQPALRSSQGTQWHAIDGAEASARLGVDLQRGLAADEVARRQTRYGLNRTSEKAGRATGVVATGDETESGRIGRLIGGAPDLATPLTRKMGVFAQCLLVAILLLAALTFAVGVWRGQPLFDMFIAAVALAVGAIPEGLPAAMTITLAIGVARMASRRAIIRKLPAVETLGSTTVICSDKTGTLTQNEMVVREADLDEGTLNAVFPRRDELRFDSARQFMATLHEVDRQQIVCAKGAEEKLLPACTAMLDDDERPVAVDLATINRVAVRMAEEGLRVLAVAPSELSPGHALSHEHLREGLVFLGLVGMIDPRPRAIGAVRTCHAAGIRVKMITGDHPGTALPITPLQILWINMSTAILLGMRLAFEPAEPDIMRRPPRPPTAPILDRGLVLRILLVSLLMLGGAFGLFELAVRQGRTLEEARTLAANVFVAIETAYLFSCRSLDRAPWQLDVFGNPWVWAGSLAMLALQLGFTYLPWANRIFQTTPLGPADGAMIAAIAAFSFLIVEFQKGLTGMLRRLARRTAQG